MKTLVTLHKEGTGKCTIEAELIQIPDLWHVAMRSAPIDRDAILEVWHLAHDLRKHICNAKESEPARGELNVGDRAKGYGAGHAPCTHPVNMGTVMETDRENALVEWDTGETLWHRRASLKRI